MYGKFTSELNRFFVPKAVPGLVLSLTAAHAVEIDAVSSSRCFRMMEFNENWARKEKHAKSLCCCFMCLSVDKASYIIKDQLGSFAFS